MNSDDHNSPENYQPHPTRAGAVQCRDCAAWADVDSGKRGELHHTGRCELSAEVRGHRVSRPRLLASSETTPSASELRARELVQAAKRGDFAAHGTESELVELVRAGRVSTSAAMNQDM